MNEEMVPIKALSPDMPYVQQDGTNNLNVTNQAGGVVNINYIIQQKGLSGSAEVLMAIQRFSREYYQLIVTQEEDVFYKNAVTMAAASALSKRLVPQEIFARCSSLTEEGIEELKTIPAIICRENTEYGGATDPQQQAVYAYVKRVIKAGCNIKVEYQPIAPLIQSKLCEKKNAVIFGLNMDCAMTDLNRCEWSVRRINLFEAFDKAGFSNLPRPLE